MKPVFSSGNQAVCDKWVLVGRLGECTAVCIIPLLPAVINARCYVNDAIVVFLGRLG